MANDTDLESNHSDPPGRRTGHRRTKAEIAEHEPRIDFAALSADALIDTTALAQWLDRAPQTIIDERLRAGGPPFIRLGRIIRYRVGDVREFLSARTIGRVKGE